MSQSGATADGECVTAFNELKMGKKHKFIIYMITDEMKIVVEETSDNDDWDYFRNLIVGKCKIDEVPLKGARYAVYDVSYDLDDGGTRNKITFITFIPDTATIKTKVKYTTSKHALSKTLPGVAHDLQVNTEGDLNSYEKIKEIVSKGEYESPETKAQKAKRS